mmetsp:Transcript_54975/g.81815  ORF Transcript_54975/g.81815 Transcript_54975/m.81815 type:complete len:92 (-) Transcript_54975:1384-1659(-)
MYGRNTTFFSQTPLGSICSSCQVLVLNNSLRNATFDSPTIWNVHTLSFRVPIKQVLHTKESLPFRIGGSNDILNGIFFFNIVEHADFFNYP